MVIYGVALLSGSMLIGLVGVVVSFAVGALVTATFYTGVGCLLAASALYLAVRTIV